MAHILTEWDLRISLALLKGIILLQWLKSKSKFTHRSWFIDNPESRRWRWLFQFKSTRVYTGILQINSKPICIAFLQHSEIHLFREQVHPPHSLQLGLTLNGGPCCQGVVDPSSNWVLHLSKLKRIGIK